MIEASAATAYTTIVIDELVTVLKGGRPAYEIAIEERHARGDFSEDV